ncbi:DUF975 family protein [Clostridium estertheticum]|uniref:DUF975 family protein n=1 Tax=Clostridium estertheticum TaxID=238834 RepID=UPI0013EEC48D|nr:DUF975 family protein [Clostridium estertheticum]MBZ9608758.1 DUF975 family protein [Clostridium estertheticum]
MDGYDSKSKSNKEIRQEAREDLSGNWIVAIIVCVLAWIFTEMFIQGPDIKERVNWVINNPIHEIFKYSTTISDGRIQNIWGVIVLIIGGPITFGVSMFFLKLIRKTNAKIEDVFMGFKYFGKTFLLNLLMGIFILLWTLLLIIPGIIASFSYSMAYYILIDNPELTSLEAINRSKEMMNGYKGKLFCLYLSFAGWFILCLVTLGIGFIWLEPYIQTSTAVFYQGLKSDSNEKKLL